MSSVTELDLEPAPHAPGASSLLLKHPYASRDVGHHPLPMDSSVSAPLPHVSTDSASPATNVPLGPPPSCRTYTSLGPATSAGPPPAHTPAHDTGAEEALGAPEGGRAPIITAPDVLSIPVKFIARAHTGEGVGDTPCDVLAVDVGDDETVIVPVGETVGVIVGLGVRVGVPLCVLLGVAVAVPVDVKLGSHGEYCAVST